MGDLIKTFVKSLSISEQGVATGDYLDRCISTKFNQ